MNIEQNWKWWFGTACQLSACIGLSVNAALISKISSGNTYDLGHYCDYEMLWQAFLIIGQFVLYLPLLIVGRILLGRWGSLSVVWWSGTLYLLVQHSLLIYANCAVDLPHG